MEILDWNGKDLPEELQKLPAGKYIIQPVEDVTALTDEEKSGLRLALEQMESGQVVSTSEVRARLDSILAR